jgi:hypothetical protein
MNLRTTLALLALLAALAAAVLWQRGREADELDLQRRLFEGVEAERVVALRVDHLARGYNLRLERDGEGRWYLTDPLAYPAAPELVQLLLEDVATAVSVRVPAEEQGAEELGFTPPTAVLEVEELLEDGSSRRTKVELGAPDPDRMRLNVRVDGEYRRCLVRLHTTLDRDADDFRSRRVLSIDPRSVVEVVRTGVMKLELDEPPVDTELFAYQDGPRWQATRPLAAALAPLDLGVVVVGAARIRVQTFVEDEPPDLARYSLDPPGMRLELRAATGEREVLLLGRRGSRPPWFLMREGFPHVWSVDGGDVERLMLPAREMYDRRLLRVLREDVDGLVLESGERRLELLREERGWSLGGRGEDGAPFGPLRADAARVDDELARLEALEFRLPEGDLAPEFEAAARIEVRVGGEALGGSLSAPRPDGTVLFRRDGDELALVGEGWLLDLVGVGARELRDRQLLGLTENELRGLELVGPGGLEAAFVRDGKGIWRREGAREEALELLPLLDALVYLKAERFAGREGTLEAPLTVRFLRHGGEPVEVRVGLLDGECAALLGGEHAVLQVADLHPRLSALLGE